MNTKQKKRQLARRRAHAEGRDQRYQAPNPERPWERPIVHQDEVELIEVEGRPRLGDPPPKPSEPKEKPDPSTPRKYDGLFSRVFRR